MVANLGSRAVLMSRVRLSRTSRVTCRPRSDSSYVLSRLHTYHRLISDGLGGQRELDIPAQVSKCCVIAGWLAVDERLSAYVDRTSITKVHPIVAATSYVWKLLSLSDGSKWAVALSRVYLPKTPSFKQVRLHRFTIQRAVAHMRVGFDITG
eukprot:scaffold33835_cov14-Prasinocladus_malaysianus.AAC.1